MARLRKEAMPAMSVPTNTSPSRSQTTSPTRRPRRCCVLALPRTALWCEQRLGLARRLLLLECKLCTVLPKRPQHTSSNKRSQRRLGPLRSDVGLSTRRRSLCPVTHPRQRSRCKEARRNNLRRHHQEGLGQRLPYAPSLPSPSSCP